MISVYDRLVDPNTATLVAGSALMIAAASFADLRVRYLNVNALDDDTTAAFRADVSSAFAWGERAIGVVRRHPVASCAVAAALTAIPAMSHAETTLSGATPWGLLQGASVVLGFIVLGPTLGLRESDRISRE